MTKEQIQETGERYAESIPYAFRTGAMQDFTSGFHAALSSDTVKGMVEALSNIEASCNSENPDHETIWHIAHAALRNYNKSIKSV